MHPVFQAPWRRRVNRRAGCSHMASPPQCLYMPKCLDSRLRYSLELHFARVTVESRQLHTAPCWLVSAPLMCTVVGHPPLWEERTPPSAAGEGDGGGSPLRPNPGCSGEDHCTAWATPFLEQPHPMTGHWAMQAMQTWSPGPNLSDSQWSSRLQSSRCGQWKPLTNSTFPSVPQAWFEGPSK